MIDLGSQLEKLSGIRILVVGDYMLDRYLNGTVSRVSPEAPVPVVRILGKKLEMGGAGNVALNILALGGKVRALTDIGDDEGGSLLISQLADSGVDTQFIFRTPLRTTSIKTRIVAQNQQMLRYDEETISPVDEEFEKSVTIHLSEILENVDGVVLSDYGKGVLTPNITKLVISGAKEKGLPVLVDPKGIDYGKYNGADYCTPNFKELKQAAGAEELNTEIEIRDAAQSICRLCGIENLLITRSEKGMSLVLGNSGEKRDYPALVKEVSDVTGAGDTVIAAFSMAVSAGIDPDSCCALSNLAASIVVSKFGTATASIFELQEAIKALRNTVENKIYSVDELVEIANRLHQEEKKIVFTNGCYDIVHAGHIASFTKAKALGDVLIVAVNSDRSVKRLKGGNRPIVCLKDRLALLQAIEVIDYLTFFEEDTPQELIETIRPDVLVKGKDWEGKQVAGADFLALHGGHVEFIDLEEGLSTTSLVEKIKKGY